MTRHHVALYLLLLVAACGPPASDLVARDFECPVGASPFRLQLVDTVILEENPANLLGNPAVTFSASPNGSLFIPDLDLKHVSVFAGNGRLRGQLGRPGGGPGEFRTMGTFGIADDTLLLQSDGGGARINAFDTRTMSYVGQVPYEGYFSWISRARDGYLVSLLSSFAVAHLSYDELIASLIGTAPAPLRPDRVPRADEYRRYPMLNAWQDVKAVEHEGGTLAVFAGTDYALALDSAGKPDTIRIPRCDRRGAPREVLDRLFSIRPATAEASHAAAMASDNTISAVLGLWRLPDGAYLVQFQDPTFGPDGKGFTGTAWMSLISPDLKRVCPDAKVVAPGSGLARVTASGDSILVLDQETDVGGIGTVRSVVRKYLIDRAGCRWIRVSQGGRHPES